MSAAFCQLPQTIGNAGYYSHTSKRISSYKYTHEIVLTLSTVVVNEILTAVRRNLNGVDTVFR